MRRLNPGRNSGVSRKRPGTVTARRRAEKEGEKFPAAAVLCRKEGNTWENAGLSQSAKVHIPPRPSFHYRPMAF